MLVNGDQFWNFLWQSDGSIAESIVNYEKSVSIKAWVQLFHRITAYLLTGLIIWYFIKVKKIKTFPHTYPHISFGANGMMLFLLVQVVLGILTIVNSVGSIPVIYGVLHQAGALVLLAFVLFSTFHINRSKLT